MQSVPRSFLALLLASVLAQVGVVSAQEQHLGEAAETIRLDHPEGEPVVIDDQSIPPAVAPVEESPYPVRLATIVEAYQSVVRELESTLGELDRGMALRDPVWKDSVESMCLQIEGLGIEIAAATPSPPYAAAHEAAGTAVREYAAAVAVVRQGVATMKLATDERLAHLREGRLWLERAQALADETRKRLELQLPPEEIVGGQGYDAGKAVCASRYPNDVDLQRQCSQIQERAVRELERRTAFGLDLEDATFNSIRNRCQLEWGTDYEGRNDCERKALARTSHR